MSGVDGDQTRLPAGTEAAGVVLIDHGAAGEDHDAVLFGKSDRQFAPMNQIAAHRVAPAHVAPAVAEGIELEEQMILALEVNQAIGVVSPIASGGKMELRAVGFLERRRLRLERQGCGEKNGESGRQDPYSLSRGRGWGLGIRG